MGLKPALNAVLKNHFLNFTKRVAMAMQAGVRFVSLR